LSAKRSFIDCDELTWKKKKKHNHWLVIPLTLLKYTGSARTITKNKWCTVNEKSINAFILQCIDTRYSSTCFSTLKCHLQGVNHDPAETGAQ
jgi:hypothetical protein